MGKELSPEEMTRFQFDGGSDPSNPNSPQFTCTEITYTKDQIKRLYEVSKCNRGIISKTLFVALDEGMWSELQPDDRSVFIVEQVEKIKSVLSSESKNEWIEEFIKQDNL